MQELLARGYQVVRIGDPSGSPFDCPGVIDLAPSPTRTELLELWCLKRSRFLIASESGPYPFALLLGVPTLVVNVTGIAGIPPVRLGDLYLPKHVVETEAGRRLSLDDLLNADYLINYRAVQGRYTYIENSEEELLEAVLEMEQGLRSARPATVEQIEFDRRLRASMESEQYRAWMASKHRPADYYIGRGRVAHIFAARYLPGTRAGERPRS